MKYIVGLLFIVIVFSVQASVVSAHHKTEVLGEATVASELNFPPVTAGPGYILPDSPLFFLDQLTQIVRVAVAMDAKSKIAVHKQIAGERTAELRIMFSRNNASGINASLFGLTSEMNKASQVLADESSRGGDVDTLSVDLNDTIKSQRVLLENLSDQSGGSLQLQLKAARASLQESKAVVEDSLPEDELWKEIDETLSTNVSESLVEAGSLAKKLQSDLDRLNEMASQAAQFNLDRRTGALQKAIDDKNSQLTNVQKQLLEQEKKKQDKIIAAQKAVNTEAKKALNQTIQAVENLSTAQEAIEDIKKQ